MRALQEQDFDKMASRVVDRFMGGSKLADAATEEAMAGSLGPDQIERLVQAANTMAFLRMMEQQKSQGGAPDMTHEFDPIDGRQVIQQILGQVQVPHMDAAGGMPHAEPDGDEAPLPDEHDEGAGDLPAIEGDNDGPFPKGDKQKAKEKEEGPKEKKEPVAKKKDEAKEAAFRSRRQRKLADVLEDQYRQADWNFADELANITRLLKVAHKAPSLATFEKDALAIDASPVGILVQNLVRDARGWDRITPDDAGVKHAAIVDRHLIIETDVTRAFERLVKIATEAHKLQQGVEYLRAQCG